MTNCFINQVPGEFDIPDFCHVYSAGAWHEDAFIIAGTDALLKIKDTIDKALETGQSSCALFVNDGEGFELIIVKTDDPAIKNKLQVPYTEDIAASNKGLSPCSTYDYRRHLESKAERKSKAPGILWNEDVVQSIVVRQRQYATSTHPYRHEVTVEVFNTENDIKLWAIISGRDIMNKQGKFTWNCSPSSRPSNFVDNFLWTSASEAVAFAHANLKD